MWKTWKFLSYDILVLNLPPRIFESTKLYVMKKYVKGLFNWKHMLKRRKHLSFTKTILLIDWTTWLWQKINHETDVRHNIYYLFQWGPFNCIIFIRHNNISHFLFFSYCKTEWHCWVTIWFYVALYVSLHLEIRIHFNKYLYKLFILPSWRI